LIPVLRPDLAPSLSDGSEVPYVAYPPDVFFGTIMTERILPQLGPGRVALPMAETALTLAALELAATGVAVAWVPETLARLGIAQGRVVDLSPVLPDCPLLVRALRLRGSRSQAEDVIWQQILALKGFD
jgi:LysR family transcriptional regulator, hypochlorite-specific transcription factor HypT